MLSNINEVLKLSYALRMHEMMVLLPVCLCNDDDDIIPKERKQLSYSRLRVLSLAVFTLIISQPAIGIMNVFKSF